MPPNGVEEWRARIGHWENRKLRWYQAHYGSRPRVPLHLHLERVISESRPMLCVLLLLSLSEIVATGVCETGNGALSSLNKLVGKARCCMCVRRSRCGRVWAIIPYSLCLALCLLLVVAGDVETNPGPISGNKLTSDDLGGVLEGVLDASAQWYNLGLQLKMRSGTLDSIRTQFLDPKDQLREMLKVWLNTSDNPTWKILIDSLRSRSVGANQLAGDLETKYCPVDGIEVGGDTSASDSRPETSVSPPSPGSQPIPVPHVMSQQTNTQESTHTSGSSPQPPLITTPSHPFTPTCTEAQTSATQEGNGEGIYGHPESDKDTHLSKHSSGSTSPPASDKPPFGCGCGKCTFFSFIERGCPSPIPSASSFPYLDLSGLTHEQQQQLRGRLRFESQEIMLKFQGLVSSIIKSLKEQQIPIIELVSHIMTLGAFDPVYKEPQTPAFHHHFSDLKSADTVSEVFVVLADYFSFFNYHVIEHIIKECGTMKDKDNLLKYKEEFDEYAKRRIFEWHPCFGPESEADHTDVFVKVDSQYENFTVIEVERFRCHLSKILRVSSQGVLRLCRVEKGCFQLMFQVPSFVQQNIFPLSKEQEKALAEERVIKLTCGQYQFLAEEYEQLHSQSGSIHQTPPAAGTKTASTPTMPELLKFTCADNTCINITKEIGVEYKCFGIFLLQDLKGQKVKSIKSKHQSDPTQINTEILEEWLAGKGKQPMTWATLVEVLRDTELYSLADVISTVKCPNSER